MPRYFFETEDGRCFPDDTGTELPDLRSARREAIATYGEMIQEMVDDVLASGSFRIVVKDESGKALFAFEGGMVDAAALEERSGGSEG